MIIELLFWISLFSLFHTYIFFPLILRLFSSGKEENPEVYTTNDHLPLVSVIMAVHNEEPVLKEKIKSLYYTNYPHQSLEVWVGSDNSDDGTNRILNIFAINYENFNYREYKHRTGKPEIINRLVSFAKGEIIIITDANIFLEPTTLLEIVKHFKNPAVGLVDTKMVHRGERITGISYQENAYINREFRIKEMESKLWGTMMALLVDVLQLEKLFFLLCPVIFW